MNEGKRLTLRARTSGSGGSRMWSALLRHDLYLIQRMSLTGICIWTGTALALGLAFQEQPMSTRGYLIKKRLATNSRLGIMSV